MQRFYFKTLGNIDKSITIKNPDLLNQLNKVLRINIGDKLAFFNGEDNIDYIFEIISTGKREIYLEKSGEEEKKSEIDFDLNIFQALPNKLEKIEYILQKGVEIGISNFYFFKAKRSQKLILSENKITRLKKIIQEAVEQSGRSRIPELIIEEDINIEYFKDNENIFFHTQDNNSNLLKNIKINYKKGVNLFVGPEGGFLNEEIEIFEKLKFKKIFLGKRILRTETVGVVAGFFIMQLK